MKSAAETFRANPKFKVEDVITELGVGEALVSFLDEKGIPGMVERAKIVPPQSQIGPISARRKKPADPFIASFMVFMKNKSTGNRHLKYCRRNLPRRMLMKKLPLIKRKC